MFSTLTQLFALYHMQGNHELVQKAMLPREISFFFFSYEGHCEEKGENIKVSLNATIILKLIKHKIDKHES